MIEANRSASSPALPPGLDELLGRLFPGARVERVRPLGVGARASSSVTKATGYGTPLQIALVDRSGERRVIVFRTARPDDFGHDRRSDRAQELLLAYDTFGAVPAHVAPLDVGAIARGGRLVSLAEADEFYLITSYAPGDVYADHLRRIAEEGAAEGDLERCRALARYLVELHRSPGSRPAAYRRAIRDLVGSGEGIFGIVDGYPASMAPAEVERLRSIERQCVEWRWRLRDRTDRLRRTHGDFHPFNVVVDGGGFTVLDASRGCEGDPADDVTCMAVNYVFFALGSRDAWQRGLRALWHGFWQTYLEQSGDGDLLGVAPPFLAWRLLVLANPSWYAGLDPDQRGALLGLAERALQGRFDPSSGDDLFR